MHDASTLWSILALYFLAAGLIGLLLGRRTGSRAAFTGVIAVAGLDVLLLLVGAR